MEEQQKHEERGSGAGGDSHSFAQCPVHSCSQFFTFQRQRFPLLQPQKTLLLLPPSKLLVLCEQDVHEGKSKVCFENQPAGRGDVAVSVSLRGCVTSIFYGFDASDTLILWPVLIPLLMSPLVLSTAQRAVQTLLAEPASTRAERGRRTRSRTSAGDHPTGQWPSEKQPRAGSLPARPSRLQTHLQPFHQNELGFAPVPHRAQKACRCCPMGDNACAPQVSALLWGPP